MNYELAKQLYDAGFPQQGFGRWVGNPDQVIWRAGDRVYVPTLEELIKACGDDFNSLVLRNRDENVGAQLADLDVTSTARPPKKL